jgi:hypothetical protein
MVCSSAPLHRARICPEFELSSQLITIESLHPWTRWLPWTTVTRAYRLLLLFLYYFFIISFFLVLKYAFRSQRDDLDLLLSFDQVFLI